MVDLLAHALLAYAAFTALAARSDRFASRHASLGVVGGVLPDLSKVSLVVGSGRVEALFGLPFSWLALHRLGPLLVLGALAAVCFERSERPAVFSALVGGGLLHLALDALVIRADGLVPPYLYPFTWWRPPSGDLYLSSELWPTLVALVLAAAVWWLTRSLDGVDGR